MATHNVQRAKHATLVGSTVDTVNLSMSGGTVVVRNRDAVGGDVLYFTIDGTTPTAAGDDTYFCGPGESVVIDAICPAVKLISAGTPDYSVEKY